MKLFDSELKVMDVLWTNGDMPARQIAAILTESIGWQYNISNEKLGNISVVEGKVVNGFNQPRELIRIEASLYDSAGNALVSKQQVQEEETQELIDKVFDGSADKLFAALVGGKRVSAEQLQKLRTLIDDMDD